MLLVHAGFKYTASPLSYRVIQHMKKGHRSALFSCIMLRLHDTTTSVNKGCQSPWDDNIIPDIFIIPQICQNTYAEFPVIKR